MNDPESLNEIDAKVFANKSNKEGVSARDHIPQIFICATMWHETKEELMEFLKSILRLDEDQCARRMAMKYLQLNEDEIDKEYYDLESELCLQGHVTNKPRIWRVKPRIQKVTFERKLDFQENFSYITSKNIKRSFKFTACS